MRRIVTAAAGTVSGLVLLFSYPTSLNRVPGVEPAASSGESAPSESSASSTATADPAPTAADPAPPTTFAGEVVATQFGPVQVEITVAAGVVTSVDTTLYPTDDRKSAQINARAVPILEAATLSTQSAAIDLVSGATVTSDAYTRSLQSALDAAHL